MRATFPLWAPRPVAHAAQFQTNIACGVLQAEFDECYRKGEYDLCAHLLLKFVQIIQDYGHPSDSMESKAATTQLAIFCCQSAEMLINGKSEQTQLAYHMVGLAQDATHPSLQEKLWDWKETRAWACDVTGKYYYLNKRYHVALRWCLAAVKIETNKEFRAVWGLHAAAALSCSQRYEDSVDFGKRSLRDLIDVFNLKMQPDSNLSEIGGSREEVAAWAAIAYNNISVCKMHLRQYQEAYSTAMHAGEWCQKCDDGRIQDQITKTLVVATELKQISLAAIAKSRRKKVESPTVTSIESQKSGSKKNSIAMHPQQKNKERDVPMDLWKAAETIGWTPEYRRNMSSFVWTSVLKPTPYCSATTSPSPSASPSRRTKTTSSPPRDSTSASSPLPQIQIRSKSQASYFDDNLKKTRSKSPKSSNRSNKSGGGAVHAPPGSPTNDSQVHQQLHDDIEHGGDGLLSGTQLRQLEKLLEGSWTSFPSSISKDFDGATPIIPAADNSNLFSAIQPQHDQSDDESNQQHQQEDVVNQSKIIANLEAKFDQVGVDDAEKQHERVHEYEQVRYKQRTQPLVPKKAKNPYKEVLGGKSWKSSFLTPAFPRLRMK